jgi:site-specific recombinase XerC
VKDRAAARVLELSANGRASAPTATRDLAIVVCLGELGLRSEELRTLRVDDLTGLRAGSATPWLHVVGKGSRERELPLPSRSNASCWPGWPSARVRVTSPKVWSRLAP